MKKHISLAGTILAAAALCWAIWGSTATVDAVPAPAAESGVSAPCAPQTQPVEPSNHSIITEPVTQPETAPVAGSIAFPESDCPQAAPVVVPASMPTEEPVAEPSEECAPTSVAEAQPQDDMIYVPGF